MTLRGAFWVSQMSYETIFLVDLTIQALQQNIFWDTQSLS